jgi:hypothetical protein
MSEPSQIQSENQRERWLKYGGNVALVTVIVIAIAVLLIWCFQTPLLSKRIDTTQDSLYSLKPQTINIIKNNKQPIKIVSLYAPAKKSTDGLEEDDEKDADKATPEQVQVVTDLLDEYRRKGNKIEVDSIDPSAQGGKVDELIEEVKRRGGKEIDKYKAVVEEFSSVYSNIDKIAATQLEKFKAALQKVDKIEDTDLEQTLFLTQATVQGVPPGLLKTRNEVQKQTQLKIPDYRGATSSIEQGMAVLSSLAGKLLEDFKTGKDNPKIPQAMRDYMRESEPAYQELKKLSDDLANKIRSLGELREIEELRQSLKAKNNILVMGENEWRVLPMRRVWQDVDTSQFPTRDDAPKKKFAGEQQITSAILSLSSKTKPRVVFVRPGGPPMTMPDMPPFQRGGPLSMIAERLREYNFEVMEKDLSGMWAMQAQMRRQFAAPEPADEEIKDAVWIVLGFPGQQGQFGMPSPSTLGPKLAAHLKAGGSALVLAVPQGDAMTEALDEWGVTVRTEAIAVHEQPKSSGSRVDFVEEALRRPFIFLITDYGDHMLTQPLASLKALMAPVVPIETQPKVGYKSTRIIPIPQTLKIWGETTLEGMSPDTIKYDPPKGAAKGGDLSPPLHGGAVVEKDNGGRLVAIGCIQLTYDHLLLIPEDNAPNVSRFPGNSELFLNSVFWLSRQEPLISISPTAMEVSRIQQIPKGVLGVWRVGVVLVLLPLLVVGAGVFMFMRRRD